MEFLGKMTKEQAEEREQLVFGRSYASEKYSMGGICYFDNMSVQTAKKLMNAGYIDPNDAQNCSPTAEEMIQFCDDDTGAWYLHGYVVSPDRADCRITFEGVRSECELTAEQALDFLQAFRFADELTAGVGQTAYCWYD